MSGGFIRRMLVCNMASLSLSLLLVVGGEGDVMMGRRSSTSGGRENPPGCNGRGY